VVKKNSNYEVLLGNCLDLIREGHVKNVDLTFFDPPYNQGKDYSYFDDSQDPERYWSWIQEVVSEIHHVTTQGGALYLMHREKNTERVLKVLRESGWNYQNLIIWRKMTSAVPSNMRYGKQYQVIAFVTKGERPRVFNKLRIDPPLPPNYKHQRKTGMYITDIWDDIRELTSGYFAGDEAVRDEEGNRIHKQQTPIALLLRIILTSSMPKDVVFDPMAGTGTTSVVADQVKRKSVVIEVDPEYAVLIRTRLEARRPSDDVAQFLVDYQHTLDLEEISGVNVAGTQQKLG
jgi:DNA modification methylase